MVVSFYHKSSVGCNVLIYQPFCGALLLVGNYIIPASREKLSIDYDDIYGFNEPQYSEFSAIEWNDSIKKLNQTDLDILYLVCIQGIGYQQIAASYGISYAAAKQRFWTAKNNLKKILFEEGDAK